MKRALLIAGCLDLLFLAIVSYMPLKDFLYVHPWLLSILAAAPALIIAFLEMRHSGEANRLREEANRLRDEANRFQQEANSFREEANEERREANAQRTRANEALGRIAEHTMKAPTKAERNAERLRQYLNARVQVVNADDSSWGNPAEIVEIKDEVVTLFSPAGYSSSSAFAARAHCDDLEIVDGAAGSIILKVLKRYGTTQNLGQVKTWAEREKPPAAPLISKGPNVFNVEYAKPASSERKRLDIFESADGQNSYMLITPTGEILYGDNVQISRQFLLLQLELEVQGFRQSASASGGSKYPLYMKTTP